MATTTELLGDVVHDLVKVKDVRIAVIVSRDGLLMVSST